jgi:hypothetical protein
MAKRRRVDSLIWGFVLIVIGLVFLLESFNIDTLDVLWRFWPVILIVWGGSKLYYGIKERNERLEKPVPPPGQEP